MAVNKVVYGEETLMDITDSTIDEQNMLKGVVGYNAAGERIVGEYEEKRHSGLEIQKRVVFIGDSYLNGGVSKVNGNDVLNENASWGKLIAEHMGWTDDMWEKYAEGGAGFARANKSGNTLLSIVSEGGRVYQDEYAKRNDVTLVICVGGLNDMPDEASESGNLAAVKSFIVSVKNLFPNAVLVMCYNWIFRPYSISHLRMIRQACAEYNGKDVYCVQNSHLWLANYWDKFEDNIHPNTTGAQIASRVLAQWLKTGSSYVPLKKNIHEENGIKINWWYDDTNLNIVLQGRTAELGDIVNELPYAICPYYRRIPIYGYIGSELAALFLCPYASSTETKARHIVSTKGNLPANTSIQAYATISNELIRAFAG